MNGDEKPIVYEWIEEREKIKVPTKITRRREYNEKLVAFIDILGMTDLMKVKKHDAEEILTILGEIQKIVENECAKLIKSQELDLLHIGDGFLIVTNLRQINRLCEILSNVQWRTLIYSGMLIRGALTVGSVRVEGRLFIGPAIIDAFKFERENAIYPRIIFLNEVEKRISKDLIKFGYIEEDQDKVKYLNFIKHNFKLRKMSEKILDQLLTTEGVKQTLNKEYTRLMDNSESENKKIAQKYGWLISKFAYHGIKIL